MQLDLSKPIIGCMPVWASPNHPADQSPCIVSECPKCNRPMWVSEKKRELMEAQPDMQCYCLTCIAIEAHSQGFKPEVMDIGKVL